MFVHLSANRMTLSLHEQAQGVEDLELPKEESLALWLKRIRSKGFVHGLQMDTLKKIQEDGLPEDDVVIGLGTPPVHEITLLHRHYELMNVVEDNQKPVDFKDLGFGKDVQAGDLLLEVIQEGPGKPGTNILGEKLPFEKRSNGQLPTIQGQIETERSGAQIQYRSKIDGFLWNNDPNVLKVTPELLWPASVDHHVGNIHTQYRVEIGGDVASGFSVLAGKGILVRGAVERHALCQSEGDIKIEGGLHQGATISAQGKVEVRFAQGATIICRGDFRVTDYLYDCEVQCQGVLTSEGKGRGERGAIVGGIISSMHGMTLASVGSANALTTLASGVDLPQVREMGELLREMKWNKAELSRHLRRLPISLADPDLQKKVHALSPERKARLKAMWGAIVELQGKKKSMEAQFRILDEKRKAWPTDVNIRIEGPLVPDVKILMGPAQVLLVMPVDRQKFYLKEGAIYSEPLG